MVLKKLFHFSAKSFQFDREKKYKHGGNHLRFFKPYGLWLSDESDYGWGQWCEDNDFRTEGLRYRHEFMVNLDDVLVLDTDEKILQFNEKYNKPKFEISAMNYPDWPEMAKTYKGIFISPYSWNLRLAQNLMWYYGWDCASACIWDLSAVELIQSNLEALKQTRA